MPEQEMKPFLPLWVLFCHRISSSSFLLKLTGRATEQSDSLYSVLNNGGLVAMVHQPLLCPGHSHHRLWQHSKGCVQNISQSHMALGQSLTDCRLR